MIKNGFTLIELLVVVLIIGILSAVALPQYEKAVMKARIVEAKTNLKALAEATDLYILANQAVPSTMADLDIGLSTSKNWVYYYRACPGKTAKLGCSLSANPTKSNLPVVGTETRYYDPAGSLYGLFEAIDPDTGHISTQAICSKYAGKMTPLIPSEDFCSL